MEPIPVAVIGAGPAGLAAAMQLNRQGISALVLERERVGGLLWNANLVENYPGFPEGISGPDLVGLFIQAADRLGVEIAQERVIEAAYQDGCFWIRTDRRELTARVLVAATGTAPRNLSDELIDQEIKHRIFSEVYPLLGSRGQRILIIGAGDAAFDYALNLAEDNQVTILNRGRETKALPLLVDRAAAHPGISYYPDLPVSWISSNAQGELLIKAGTSRDQAIFLADHLIAALGRDPEISFADRSIIKGRERLQSQQRLFMIGDLVNGAYRQTAIAVGDGIKTAMIISEILSKDKL